MNPRSTHQAQTLGFEIQQQMLAQQRSFWDGLFDVSQTNVQTRTIHQDPDELGYWFENA